MRIEQYVDSLVAVGRHHFTSADAMKAVGGSEDAVRAQLRRLKLRGRVASPMRSFHVVVSPEYRAMGCPPAEHFIDQLMEYVGEPYYVALLSAAERYGAAHQRPQSLYVMVAKNRASIECGQTRVRFVARGDLERMPTRTFRSPRGYLRYATPEVTALELVGYPRHAGGMNNVITVLAELSEQMTGDALTRVAEHCPVGWSQRLGHLLEMAEAFDLAAALAPFVGASANSYIPLRRAVGNAGAERDARWKVLVNVDVDPDE